MTSFVYRISDLGASAARASVMACLAVAAALSFSIASARSSDAATYCQMVCQENASACFEQCLGTDPQKKKKKIVKLPPPPSTEPTPVPLVVGEDHWSIKVFDPKGGGGNGGGGGGNGR